MICTKIKKLLLVIISIFAVVLTTNKAPSSVTVIAGFNAACCAVPDSNPTADVSINDNTGPHNQIPIAGIAKYIIFFTLGASNRLGEGVIVLDEENKVDAEEGFAPLILLGRI